MNSAPRTPDIVSPVAVGALGAIAQAPQTLSHTAGQRRPRRGSPGTLTASVYCGIV